MCKCRRRNPEGYDMPSDLDQALLLYFDGQEQDKPSTQEEPHKPLNFVKETLNIFPSQPMDGEPTPTPKASMSAPPIAGFSRRSPAPAAADGRPLTLGKTSKAAFKVLTFLHTYASVVVRNFSRLDSCIIFLPHHMGGVLVFG
jgi:transcription factor TGA